MASIACDQICDHIKKQLRSPAFEHMILTEQNVAAQCNVSRGTAREALQRLCHERYLVSLPRKGYVLRRINRIEYGQIRDVRLALESLAIQRVVESCTDEQIQGLRQHTGAIAGEMVNAEFHLALADLTANPYLVESLSGLVYSTTRFVEDSYIHLSDLPFYHQEIIDALLRRDAATAIHYLRLDIGVR